MANKIVLGVFCALALLFANGEVIDLDSYSPDGLIEDAQEALRKLSEIVTNAIKDASEKLSNLINELVEVGNKIVEGTMNKINELVGGYLDKIKQMEETAKELGINITECIVENKKQIIDLPKNLAENLVNCVNKEIDEGKKIVSDAIDEIMKYPNIVSELFEKLKKCKPGIIGLPCISGIIIEAGAQVAKIPVAITSTVLRTVRFMATVKADIAVCGTGQTIIAGKNLTEIFFDITKCYEEKIAGATTTERGTTNEESSTEGKSTTPENVETTTDGENGQSESTTESENGQSTTESENGQSTTESENGQSTTESEGGQSESTTETDAPAEEILYSGMIYKEY